MNKREKLLDLIEPYEDGTLYTCVKLGGIISHLYDSNVKEYSVDKIIKELQSTTIDDFADTSVSCDEGIGFEVTKRMKESYIKMFKELIKELQIIECDKEEEEYNDTDTLIETERIINEMKAYLYNYNHTIVEEFRIGSPIWYICDGGSGLCSISGEMDLNSTKEYDLDFGSITSVLKSEIKMLKLHIEEMHKHYNAQVIDVDYCQEEYDYDIECPKTLIKEFEIAIVRFDNRNQ